MSNIRNSSHQPAIATACAVQLEHFNALQHVQSRESMHYLLANRIRSLLLKNTRVLWGFWLAVLMADM